MNTIFRVIVMNRTQDMEYTQYAALISLTSPEKRMALCRKKNWQDIQNSLLGDILVRREICRLTGLKNDELRFEKNKYQKPYLTNKSDIHYNVSHSGNIITVVFDDKPVGIDVEIPKPGGFQIAKKVFYPDEYIYFNQLNETEKTGYLYKTWTMKEAYLKKEGVGLSYPMRFLNVDKTSGVQFFMIPLANGAVCHVCASMRAQPPAMVSFLDKQMFACYFSAEE